MYYYQKRRRKKWGRLFFLLFLLLTSFYIFNRFQNSGNIENSKLKSPSVDASNQKNEELKNIMGETKFNSPSLENAVKIALEGTKGSYAVAIKNLKTNESYYFNEHKSFEPGSIYKVWVMATAINQIQNGTLEESEVLTQKISTLNEKFYIDKEDAELTDGTITLTTSQALEQMITISHNYAALLLTEKIRLSSVSNFLKQNGFKESSVSSVGKPPISTASDIAIFFEKLYKGQLGNPDSTTKMLNLLSEQKLNNKLPKFLPEDVAIAHKTGEIGYFSHDAGIIFSEKGDYIIVVLSETEFPAAAEERIAQISKNVYEYFKNR